MDFLKSAFLPVFLLLGNLLFCQTPDSSLLKRGDAKRLETNQLQNKTLDKVLVKTDSLPGILDTNLIAKTAKPGLGKRFGKPVKNFFTKDYPKPRRAMFLSLVFPGGGQMYNRSWWKVPLVYGALGGMLWLENNNITYYRELKTAYFNRVNDLEVDPKYERYDAQSLKYNRDAARKNLELSSLFLGLTWLLSAAEAFTDAHLKRFDVSDDLSLKFKPTLDITPSQSMNFGVSATFRLCEKPKFLPRNFSFNAAISQP